MSQQQHNNIPARQSYSSPSYPSPSPSTLAYAYPPPNGQNSEQQYQGSPTSSHQSLPSGVNLPPLRTMDGRPASQQAGQTSPGMASQAPAQLQPGAMGSPLPPPITPMPPQYYPNIPPPGHGMTDPNQPMRYPLAPDARMMSGGRHKKEIKRRTKTGCLTCRKRRIKVSRHPLLFTSPEHHKLAQTAVGMVSAMECSRSGFTERARRSLVSFCDRLSPLFKRGTAQCWSLALLRDRSSRVPVPRTFVLSIQPHVLTIHSRRLWCV